MKAKYRAWDNVKSKMYYVGEEDNIVFTFDSNGIVATDITEDDEEFKTLHHLEYMQYFGFGDVKEHPLYPGDIVKTFHTRASLDGTVDTDPFSGTGYEEYEKIGVLEYHLGYHFGPRLRWKKGHMMIPNTSTLWRMKAEVIGNKFEHPHLLKE